MKILRIGGKNLASLASEFSVDFENGTLGSAGLFAICGPTGAGKSTLLDALCLALYDATPRLLKTGRNASTLPDVGADMVSTYDPRTLLRRGAAEGYAEVDFVGSDGQRYRSRWSVRRAYSKATGGLQASSITLHKLPELAAIGRKKNETMQEIVQRVGLTFEQFTRAVLLAQNEFSAFLKSDEGERGELLETLTGTTVYTTLSRRAFERYKLEQGKLQTLTVRLSDQVPLDPDARAALEAALATGTAQLSALEARKQELDTHWRWHQEDARLAAHVADGETALAAARAAHAEAEPRRQQLALTEAIQPARALLTERARLEEENRKLADQLAAARQYAERTGTKAADAAAGIAAAQEALAKAEAEQLDAAPLLDQAKALDAQIGALATADGKVQTEVRHVEEQMAEAVENLTGMTSRRAALVERQAERTRWFEAHAPDQPLAQEWGRWEKVLGQAAVAMQDRDRLARIAGTAAQALPGAAAAAAQAQAVLAAINERLAAAVAARTQADASLAAFDPQQMQAERTQLDAQREGLTLAQRRFGDWSALHAALASAQAKLAAAETESAAFGEQLATVTTSQPALQAALAQAQTALNAARLACAQSTEELRATLVDGEPCPVCGAAEHPYKHQDAALQAVFATLEHQVIECRAALDRNLAAHASLTSSIDAATRAKTTLAAEATGLAERHAQAQAAWSVDALAQQDGIDAAWFERALEEVRARAAGLQQRDRALAEARRIRDDAQAAHDLAAQQHDAAQQSAHTAQTTLTETRAAAASAQEQLAFVQRSLDAYLQDLDGALGSTAWRDKWSADPAAFLDAKRAVATTWAEYSQAQGEDAKVLVALDIGVASAQARHDTSAINLTEVRARAAKAREALDGAKAARMALFEGKPVREVEQKLAAAIAARKTQLESAQVAADVLRQTAARAAEALVQTEARTGQQVQALEQARSALVAWVATFNAGAGTPALLTGVAQLEQLLARTLDDIAAERSALAAFGSAVAAAETVLAERRTQREQHQYTSPNSSAQSADTLSTLIQTAAAEWQTLNDTVLAQRLQLAQDDQRLQATSAMQAEIAAQQEVERRWARMSELIGSADGKKFRNYAQQFTLDVLLGYANSHLQHLARRYRLERLVSSTGPSLGLVVRDQDMGGEIRSVNSLSGGESFLVSLALALGLASLSSNRVRVESLFIDEGFGSLDAETLRVAMDALDGLQSMGRKVGVISHVQEMTERIAARILVQPAGGGLSTISVP